MFWLTNQETIKWAAVYWICFEQKRKFFVAMQCTGYYVLFTPKLSYAAKNFLGVQLATEILYSQTLGP